MNINHALSVRSDFSVGESTLQIDRMVAKGKELGYESIALVDIMSISAMVAFTEKCKKAGIKPIVGVTVRVYDDPLYKSPKKGETHEEKNNRFYWLKVYAKTEAGVRSIIKLLSKGFTKEYFYYHARVGIQEILDLEDVVVTTGDFFNLFYHPGADTIMPQLQGRFGSDLYIELSMIDTPLYERLNAHAMRSAALYGAYVGGTIATRPVLYETPEDADTLDVLRTIAQNAKISDQWVPKPFVRDFCMRPSIELAKDAVRLLPHGSRAAPLASIAELVGKCTYEFKKQVPSLPKMADDEFKELVKECGQGWRERFSAPVLGHQPTSQQIPQYTERLTYELSVLKKMGFSGYFLLVQDIVRWAKTQGIIVGPGRGCFLPGSPVKCSQRGLIKAIEDVRVGDEVIAHDGSTQKVIATLSFPCDEEILELEFDDKKIIRCTKDHEFYTKNRGWVRAEELCGEDELEEVEGLARTRHRLSQP